MTTTTDWYVELQDVIIRAAKDLNKLEEDGYKIEDYNKAVRRLLEAVRKLD